MPRDAGVMRAHGCIANWHAAVAGMSVISMPLCNGVRIQSAC